MILLNQMKKYLKTIQDNRAFTLVETLIALSIFTLSVLALMFVSSQGISDTASAKNKIIATYLAQEGIEYMRNMRDTYILYSASSSAGFSAFNTKLTAPTALCDQPDHPNGCYFDNQNLNYSDETMPITDTPMTACASSCPILLYDSATGKYNYATGDTSDFIRRIQSIQLNANETKVFVTVYWIQGSGTAHITFSESLFNWLE